LRPLRLPRPPVLAAAQADNKETANAIALFLFATALTVSAQAYDPGPYFGSHELVFRSRFAFSVRSRISGESE
jgi:hypothetical protein